MKIRYLSLANRAPVRLAILRGNASRWNEQHPHAPLQSPTWREMRFAKFTSRRGLSQGFNVETRTAWGKTTEKHQPIWSTFDGPAFRNEQFADEVLRLSHTGWYTDREFCDATYRGIVAALPHGRFISGYYSSDNGERVYFPELFTDAQDAARSGDHEAEHYAEQEADYQDRYRAAQAVQDRIDSSTARLAECLALRNDRRPCFAGIREEARRCMESIREARTELATDYAGVL